MWLLILSLLLQIMPFLYANKHLHYDSSACKLLLDKKLEACIKHNQWNAPVLYYYLPDTQSCFYASPVMLTFSGAKKECQMCGGRLFQGLDKLNLQNLPLMEAAEIDLDPHPKMIKKSANFWTGVEFAELGLHTENNFSVIYHQPISYLHLGAKEREFVNVDMDANFEFSNYRNPERIETGDVFQLTWSVYKNKTTLGKFNKWTMKKFRYLCEFVLCAAFVPPPNIKIKTKGLSISELINHQLYEFGTVLELDCVSQYNIFNNSIICGPEGIWLGNPHCIILKDQLKMDAVAESGGNEWNSAEPEIRFGSETNERVSQILKETADDDAENIQGQGGLNKVQVLNQPLQLSKNDQKNYFPSLSDILTGKSIMKKKIWIQTVVEQQYDVELEIENEHYLTHAILGTNIDMKTILACGSLATITGLVINTIVCLVLIKFNMERGRINKQNVKKRKYGMHNVFAKFKKKFRIDKS